jgi:hypothetical protein
MSALPTRKKNTTGYRTVKTIIVHEELTLRFARRRRFTFGLWLDRACRRLIPLVGPSCNESKKDRTTARKVLVLFNARQKRDSRHMLTRIRQRRSSNDIAGATFVGLVSDFTALIALHKQAKHITMA